MKNNILRFLIILLPLLFLFTSCTDSPTGLSDEDMGFDGAPDGTLVAAYGETEGMSISTEKDDYSPGETVTITGAGWFRDQGVSLVITEDSVGANAVHTLTANVDENGGFVATFPITEAHIGVTFTMVATGQQSDVVVTVVFTDGNIEEGTATIAMRDAATCTSPAGSIPSGSSICAHAAFTIVVPPGGNTNVQLRWQYPAGTNVAISQTSFLPGVSGPQTFDATYTPTAPGTWTVLLCEGNNSDLTLAGCQSGRLRATQTFEVTGGTVNQPPTIAADNATVTVDEGQTASNTGTVSDPNGDTVTLSASVGTVTDNNDGTWSWSFGTNDGPAQSQTVTITADDGNGGIASTTFELTVNNVAPTVNITSPLDGALYPISQMVNVSASFTDPGSADTHTCTITWGDGMTDGPFAVTSPCTGSHSYNHNNGGAGVYTITVTVTDDDGGTDSESVMVVVYDPSAGFVTGGGWINSNSDWVCTLTSCTVAEGNKAHFGFVSKYQKGATVPTGNTQFQFQAGGLNFHSSVYEWLVVNQNGTNAQYKGSGTINGTGGYKFMLWAGDGSPDTFRIKIWVDGNEANPVFDNGGTLGTNQAINGGSIVIHTGSKK